MTIQDGGCRNLGFRKTAVISLVFDRSSPKYWKHWDFVLEQIHDIGNAYL